MPFEKGKSGNPGGRPRKDNPVKVLAKEYSTDAIQAIKNIMDDVENDARTRLQAANAILDRAFGRPEQAVSAEVKGDVVPVLQLIRNERDSIDSGESGEHMH